MFTKENAKGSERTGAPGEDAVHVWYDGSNHYRAALYGDQREPASQEGGAGLRWSPTVAGWQVPGREEDGVVIPYKWMVSRMKEQGP